ILILGLSGFATLHRNTCYALYGMDVREPHNESGVTELACDAVVAFLTTPMRTRQDNSHTHSSPSEIVAESAAARRYDCDECWQKQPHTNRLAAPTRCTGWGAVHCPP